MSKVRPKQVGIQELDNSINLVIEESDLSQGKQNRRDQQLNKEEESQKAARWKGR